MSTNLSSLPVTTLGTPAIGPRRELKLALESFWSGASSQQALIDTVSDCAPPIGRARRSSASR
jgi:5-methyltetrahydropteroyltriglutamate--homocysteine methyltransferase